MKLTSLRVVPDTNVVLASHFASPNSPNAEFFERWLNDEFEVLYSADTISEYAAKLVEKKIPSALITRFLVSLLELGEPIDIQHFHLRHYPSDSDDIPFILCAVNGSATHLVSYDTHLLSLANRYEFVICDTLHFLADLRRMLN